MAIQDQINRITNEVNTQSDLIAQIASALDGKAAGGSGGVCPTVTLNGSIGPFDILASLDLDNVWYSTEGIYKSEAGKPNEDMGEPYAYFSPPINVLLNPYILHDVNINQPVVILASCVASLIQFTMSSNVTMVSITYTGSGSILGIFTITDTNPATITLEV